MPPVLLLLIGVLAVSSASLLIRLAPDASPLVIGCYRLAIASLFVIPAALLQHLRHTASAAATGRSHAASLPSPPGGRAAPALTERGRQSTDPGLRPGYRSLRTEPALALTTLASGLFLALHFASWITSLRYTSVASSTVLVTTTPVLLALMPRRWRADPLSPASVLGILIALAGTALIAFGDAGIDPGLALGDALAFLGAAAMAGHRITGRRLLRGRTLSPALYLAMVYPVAAFALAAAAMVEGAPFAGFAPATYGVLLALGLGPQLIGHSSFNLALTRVSAVAVSTAVTGEPVGATLLALLFLREIPTLAQLAGGAIVLTGVYLVLRNEVPARGGRLRWG